MLGKVYVEALFRSWAVLERSWDILFFMRPLGAVFARGNEVKSLLGGLRVVLLDLGSLLGRLEAVSGRSWAVLSRS